MTHHNITAHSVKREHDADMSVISKGYDWWSLCKPHRDERETNKQPQVKPVLVVNNDK